jgi:hypothetical protein
VVAVLEEAVTAQPNVSPFTPSEAANLARWKADYKQAARLGLTVKQVQRLQWMRLLVKTGKVSDR